MPGLMRYRRAILLVAAIGLLVGLGPAAWGQAIPRATCLDCHEQEGMEYAVIRATPYNEIPVGETVDFDVVVANPWLHDTTSALVTVNLSEAQGVSFETADPLHQTENVTIDPGSTQNITFQVEPGATAVRVRMAQSEDPTDTGGNDVDTWLTLPDNSTATAAKDGLDTGDPVNQQLPGEPSPAQTVEQIVINDDRLATTGEWTYSLERVSGNPQEPVEAQIDVLYNSTNTLSQRISQTIGPGQSANATFPIKGTENASATVQYEVTVTDFYEHPSGVQAQDEGNATLSGETSFGVGEQLQLGEAGPVVPETPPFNAKMNARLYGELTGFIGLFMIPLSLVLGGAFGRRNVLAVNKLATSARLRVLWHNALSFFLLGISIIHLLLFLYEPVYGWSVGMVWGGIGTLALIGLGITGGFQRRIARSLGYDKWRLLHIAMATGFVAATLAHVIVDGAHFDFLRDWLGFT